jgi:K+-transporting ATPase ATPase A chain
VNAAHDSFTPLGGGTVLFHMMLGEVTPGGTGTGLYGMLILAILAVFVAGLMVGRTPEYLKKKITAREIKLVSLYILTTPTVVLVGASVAMGLAVARASIFNTDSPHGFSEVLYAFTSAGNNNGSAFGGLSANIPFYNTALGLVMLLGRFVPIVFALALAGSLAQQQPVPVTQGTLPTHKALFVTLLVGVVLIVTGLTYFPALTLGPLAEGL